MRHQLTDNETWAQALLFFVFQPMVATKSGRYPLVRITEQFTTEEQPKFAQGIDALVEMNIFVMDGKDICITNRSEALVQVLEYMATQSEEDVQKMLQTHTDFALILATINNDRRFAPPPALAPRTTPQDKGVAHGIAASGTAQPQSNGLFNFGVVLTLIGIVGLIYPLFGAQNRILYAVGRGTDLNPTVLGLICLIIGVGLIFVSRSRP